MARFLSFIFCCSHNRKFCSYGSGPFTFLDIFTTFLSIGSFLADIGTDIIVIIQYYLHGHVMWMLLTTGLVCIPSLIVQIFSIRWYIIDGTITNFIWIIHVLQLGVFQRYIKLLSVGMKIRENNDKVDLSAFHQQQSDICMLRLFESFMESAPQLVLQLYIMVSTDEWNLWTATSAIASIFSLSWGIAAYSKAMRNVLPEKNRLSWWGLLFQSLWRIGMVSSRVFAMVLFAAAYGSWLILVMVIHCFSMTVWVILQKTDFCSTWWEERLYNGVVGVIYCFCYFNIKEGRSRFRMSIYYLLTILQNVGFLLAFYLSNPSSEVLKRFMMLWIPSGTVIGLISMLIYYRFFHPSGSITFQTSIKTRKESNISGKQCICCTLKTCRKLKEKGNKTSETCQTPTKVSTDYCDIISTTSANSIQDNICPSDLHRSHSLNCSYGSHDLWGLGNFPFQRAHHRKVSANHHRIINYHFRLAVNNGLLSSKIHCSCLVLMKNIVIRKDNVSHTLLLQHSKSLPNLEGSFNIGGNIQSSNSCSGENSIFDASWDCNANSTVSDEQHLPIINRDHVIRIDV